MPWLRQVGTLFSLGLLLGGCTSPQISNLTPSKHIRNDEGLYHFEAAFHTRQRAIDESSIDAQVKVDQKSYPMRKTQTVQGRWESWVPIPETTDQLDYRYQFNYVYEGLLFPQKKSITSEPYRLQIKPSDD